MYIAGNLNQQKILFLFFCLSAFFRWQWLALSNGQPICCLKYIRRTFDYNQSADGIRQILWGLFKKVVIADNCAGIVNETFTNFETLPGSSLLIGAVFFAFQIYGDFSGYSDMALGIGKLLGFKFLRNFNYPYFSRNIAEFWRRWHISLMTWFRDYLYIPLGGSRVNKWKIVRNTFIIYLVSGLWHGANWTFIFWGFYHALLFIPLILTGKNRKYTNVIAENRLLPNIKEMAQMIITFGLVVIRWIFFRADTITDAVKYLIRIENKSLFSIPIYMVGIQKVSVFIILLIVIEWFQRTKQHGLEIDFIKNKFLRISVYYFILFIILEFGGNQQSFIYFQF